MKTNRLLSACILFSIAVLSTAPGEGALHTFTSPDGRTLKAVIKAHNPSNGKIQIELKNRKKRWVLPKVFCEADQQYIQQWIAANQFLSSVKFKIQGDSSDTTKIKYHSGDSKFKAEERTEITYEISLANRTDFPLKDLRIECRGFINNRGYDGNDDFSRVDGSKISIDEIPVGKNVTQRLQPIVITTTYRVQTDYTILPNLETVRDSYAVKTSAERLKGFWIKVYGPKIDGKRAVRDWCYPSDITKKYEWQDTTESNYGGRD